MFLHSLHGSEGEKEILMGQKSIFMGFLIEIEIETSETP